MMSRLAFDALAAAILALTALLGAYMPALLASRDRLAGGSGRSLPYILGNMLSAGVMVSAGFCHLLGDAMRMMPKMRFPLAPFLCGTGYMLTLLADKIVSTAAGGHGHAGCGHGAPPPAHGHGHRPPCPAADSCCAVEVLAGVDIMERGASTCMGDKHSDGEPEAVGLLDCTPPRGARPHGHVLVRQGSSGSGGGAAANGGDMQHLSGEGVHERLGLTDNGSNGLMLRKDGGGAADWRHGRDSSDSLVFEVGQPGSGGSGASGGVRPLLAATAAGGAPNLRSVSFLTAVLMGVALCFHSLLEGAAMGAQPTISNSLHIFIAIVSHKGLAAYALGSSIVDSEASMHRFWSVVLPFTFASPVGIFLGYIVSDLAKGVGAASISALASGTFLYVAYMEVIPKELRDPAHMALKLAALITGFALMSLLAVWA